MKRIHFYLLLAFLFNSTFVCSQNTKGYIINIEGGNIYIDLTTPTVSVGDELGVYVSGGYMTHSVTKRRVKKADELICKMLISSMHADYSVAQTNDPSSLNKLKVGQVVQLIEKTEKKIDKSSLTTSSISSKPNVSIYNKNQLNDNINNGKEGKSTAVVFSGEKTGLRTTHEHVSVYKNRKLTLQEKNNRIQNVKSFCRKGTRVFVLVDCTEDERFKQILLNEMGAKGIWRFVDSPQESDFILKVQGISRPHLQFTVTDMYFMVFDKDEHLLWKSDLYFGHKVWATVNSDILKRATRKYVNQALMKDIRKAKNVPYETGDILGLHQVTDKKYKSAEDWYWKGIDYFSQYNNKKSIKMFSKAISVNPYHALAYKYRAIAFYNLSKFGDAKNDILKAMKFDPFCQQNDTIYYSIMVGKNDKYMRVWGPGGTMDRISSSLMAFSNALQSVPTSNSYSNTVQASEATRRSSSNTASLHRVTCSFCKGTGKNPAREHSAFYDYSTEDYSSGMCEICGSNSNHYHKPCPSCNGKGYINKVLPNR